MIFFFFLIPSNTPLSDSPYFTVWSFFTAEETSGGNIGVDALCVAGDMNVKCCNCVQGLLASSEVPLIYVTSSST